MKGKYMCLYIYLPRWSCSREMREPKAATMIMQRGLKAVAKTGPLIFITTPCT